MLKKSLFSLLLLAGLFSSVNAIAAAACGGRFPNPITDICWTCIFPINIGGMEFTSSERTNFDPPPPFMCSCPAPPPIFIRYGIGISFWEPARVAEIVRTPFCSPTLGGTVLAPPLGAPAGTNKGESGDGGDGAFYHVHWLQYPVLNWLGMAITSTACYKPETLDVAYMSELDPLWDSDELTFLINPEAALFANPVAQAACIADSVSAAAFNFGLDLLFWCSGSQGSVYPLSGSHAKHIGGVDSAFAETHKMIFKLHRQLTAFDTSTYLAMCAPMPQPIMRKTQYKGHMMYPVPYNFGAFGFGTQSVVWGAGREFPYEGEDFSYLIWRKQMCCAF